MEQTMKLCECGCGKPAPIAKVTCKRLGHIKGQPGRFRKGHWARTDANKGENHGQWIGGRRLHESGYVEIRKPNHPRSRRGYVFEHILVAERALGRFIVSPIEVHHFNEDRQDNRNGNLVICEDRAFHQLLHARLTAYRACGDPTARQCWQCREWDPACDRGKGQASYHKRCFLEYKRTLPSQNRALIKKEVPS